MAGPRGARRPTGGPPLVIGLGNEHRGDDALGVLVARRLRPRLGALGRVVELPSEATRLLDVWDGVGVAFVVDAVSSGAAAGTILRIEVGSEPLPSPLGATSTHGLSLGQAVALGQALGRMPRRLVIYGVEGSRFATGDPLSAGVAGAIDRVADEIETAVREVAARSTPPGPGGSRNA